MDRTLTCGISVLDEQGCVVDHLLANPVTVVSAGAGTGKTYTTVAAVLELIEHGRAQADQFILITFTNKAADELRQRLQDAFATRVAREVGERRGYWFEQQERLSAAFVGTIHGFCKSILEDYGYIQDVAREASVSLSSGRLAEAISSVIEALASTADPASPLAVENGWQEYELRECVRAIYETARNQGMDLQDLVDATRRQVDEFTKAYRVTMAEVVLRVHHAYETASRQSQQLDAAGLLEKTALLLDGPEGDRVGQQLGRRFRRLFVDEFQDTSDLQTRIVRALQPHLEGVLLVGDRKQAIYAFAGADVSLIDRFARECGVTPLPLRVTRRPSRPLLDAQTALFSRMRSRFPNLDEALCAHPEALNPHDGLPPIAVFSAPATATDRLNLLAQRLGNLIGTAVAPDRGLGERIAPGHLTVLTRSNGEVRNCVNALTAVGINARADAGTPFFQRPEIVATYRFLNFLVRYPDDAALMEALVTPHLGQADLSDRQASLLAYGFQRGTPLTDALADRSPDLQTTIANLRKASRTATVPQILGMIEQAFQLKSHYRALGQEDAALALDRLRDHARSLFSYDEALTLRTFVSALRRDIETNRDLRVPDAEERTPAYVRVMTIHRAKGLEFPIVVIPDIHKNRLGSNRPPFLVVPGYGLEVDVPGVQGGTFSPNYWQYVNAMKQRQLAEEMRLFYVAITRARQMVVLFGDDADQPKPFPSRTTYSWQDEVLRAREVLGAARVHFGPVVRPSAG